MMMGFRPTETGVSLQPFYGIEGNGLRAWWAVRIAKYLFQSFLRKDIQILDGIRFRTDQLNEKDETLRRFLDFLFHLPFIESKEVAI